MTKQICNIEQRGSRFGCHTHKVQFGAEEVIVEGKCPLGCEPNEIPPEKCPEPVYHTTHRYCPACSWREPEEAKPEHVGSIEDRMMSLRVDCSRLQFSDDVEALKAALFECRTTLLLAWHHIQDLKKAKS